MSDFESDSDSSSSVPPPPPPPPPLPAAASKDAPPSKKDPFPEILRFRSRSRSNKNKQRSFSTDYSGANAAVAEEELEIHMTPTLDELMKRTDNDVEGGKSEEVELNAEGVDGTVSEKGAEAEEVADDIERGESEEVELNADGEAIELKAEPDDGTVRSGVTKERSFLKGGGGGGGGKKKKCLGLMALLLIAGGGAAAALYFYVFAPRGSIDASKEVAADEGEAADEPASAPLEPPEEAVPSEVAMYTLRKVLPAASFALISQEGSPQSAAFDYVLNQDPFVYNWEGILSEDEAVTRAFVQRYALNTLYYSLGGENWDDATNWNSKYDVCTWYGVGCDGIEYRTGASGSLGEGIVTHIQLSDNSLRDKLPGDLAGLAALTAVELHSNSFQVVQFFVSTFSSLLK